MNFKVGKDLWKHLSILLFVVVNIFLINPLTFTLKNLPQLNLDFFAIMHHFFIIAFLIYIVATIIIIFLPEKIKNILIKILFGSGLFCYLEFMLIMPTLGKLDGKAFNPTNYLPSIALEIIFAISIAFLLIKLRKTENYLKNIATISIILLSLNAASFVFECYIGDNKPINNDEAVESYKKYAIDYSKYNVYAKNQNIVIILIDTLSGGVFESYLELHPEYKHLFNDFEFYPNAYHHGGGTTQAVPAIFTGKVCDQAVSRAMGKDYYKFLKKEFSSERNILTHLKKNGVSNHIFTFSPMTLHLDPKYVDNLIDIKKSASNVKAKKYIRKTLEFQIYPTLFKRSSYEYMTNVSLNQISDNSEQKNYDVRDFYILFKDGIKISDENKMFKFYHLFGLHPPYTLDENLNKVELYKERKGDTVEIILTAQIKLLNNYFSKLKEAGIYNKTAIIVMGDHGTSERISPLQNRNLHENPLLLYKGISQSHDQMAVIKNVVPSNEDVGQLVLYSAGINKEKWNIDSKLYKSRLDNLESGYKKILSGKSAGMCFKKSKSGLKADKIAESKNITISEYKYGNNRYSILGALPYELSNIPLYYFTELKNKSNNEVYIISTRVDIQKMALYENGFFSFGSLGDISRIEDGNYTMNLYATNIDDSITKYRMPLDIKIVNDKIIIQKMED